MPITKRRKDPEAQSRRTPAVSHNLRVSEPLGLCVENRAASSAFVYLVYFVVLPSPFAWR